MTDHVRVAVIGGGIIGCRTLYELARLGWKDLVLLERGELTQGSTWHAAGMVAGFSENGLITRIMKESLDTYARLEAETGVAVGFHKCGGIRLAHTADEMDENRRFLGIARGVGMEAEMVGLDRLRALYPLLEVKDIAGALWLPNDGYTDPSQTAHALAKGAREKGAQIHRQTEVQAIRRKPGGGWRLSTTGGEIDAEIVVNCGGMWAKEISALVGGVLPAVSIEHEYLVTETIPEIAALDFELPMLWDMSVPMYTRSDRKGLIVSCYEDHPKFFGVDGVPKHFGQELLPPDLDRTESKLAAIFAMIPPLAEVGIRTVVNGPTPRSPDMRPLVGPAHGYDDFFVMCGVSGGFLFSATARYLAEWIVEGEPSINLAPFDVRRFGDYGDKHYAVARLSSGHAFASASYPPHFEPPEARPAWTTSLYDRLKAKGAVFGVQNGWEVANWFAPKGVPAEDRLSYDRTNWFPHVGAEHRAVTAGVGVLDHSALGKFEVSGEGAEAHLDRVSANRLPAVGELAPSPMLTAKGGIAALTMIGRLAGDRFYVTSAPGSTQRDVHWLGRNARQDVRIDDVTHRTAVLTLAGPQAEQLLARLGGFGWTAAGHPAFSIRELRIASVPVRVIRHRLGAVPVWELHHPMQSQIALYDAVMAAGAHFGIVDFGMRTLDSLRLEAARPLWGADIAWHSDPWRSGLGAFVALNKGEFVGREAALRAREQGRGRHLVRLEIAPDEARRQIDPWGDEPVLAEGRDVGVVTSAAFGHGAGRCFAFAEVDHGFAEPGRGVEIEILGERYPARIVAPPA